MLSSKGAFLKKRCFSLEKIWFLSIGALKTLEKLSFKEIHYNPPHPNLTGPVLNLTDRCVSLVPWLKVGLTLPTAVNLTDLARHYVCQHCLGPTT